MALVAALGLMMLAAGLLAGAVIATVELQRATRTLGAVGRAEAEVRRGLAIVVQGWDAGLDSLPIGGTADRGGPVARLDGMPVTARTRVRRLASGLYAASIAVQVGDSAAPLAVRRARLLLARRIDTAAGGASARVTPVSRWSLVELP
jgi:hypothetical protein